jgi:predicted RND superfamily exporter protein
MSPSWRKPVGMLGILAYITLWVVLVASFAGPIGQLPTLLQLAIYLIAGVVWIAPLRPALIWMEGGRHRP